MEKGGSELSDRDRVDMYRATWYGCSHTQAIRCSTDTVLANLHSTKPPYRSALPDPGSPTRVSSIPDMD
jgi:hypothetical protein